MSQAKKNFSIEGREIGPSSPPYIIAELSANHNGSLDRALQTIEVAAKMGVEAVKLQTYTADTLTIDSKKEDFKISGGLWDGYTLYELYQKAHTPFEWHEKIFDHARKVGVTCFSTPFDESAVDLLEDLNVPAYKIASFELVDLPLIQYVARTGKPMIMSTGMANLDEIDEAVETARENGCSKLALLHCISGYPAPADQSNLLTIPDLAKRYNLATGLSDHTLGTTVAITGVALGANIIEKHFTLSREDKGPDSEFSLEPEELKQLVDETEVAWKALGSAGYERKPVEESSIKFRRSIYVTSDVKAGETFTCENIRRIRPGFGLPPKEYTRILGLRAAVDIEKGAALQEMHVEDFGSD